MFTVGTAAPSFRPRWFLMVGTLLVGALTAGPAFAQNETALRAFFEGHPVSVQIDMPSTADGVDIQADASRALDLKDYRDRLKRFGIAIHAGDSVLVTLVRVKKDLIEFQLGGGGYGTFGDDTGTTVDMPLVQPSAREKDLERLVRDEKDDRRRRELRRDLEDVRDRRERENRRITAEKEAVEAAKRERLADRRLHGGSRFNLRYAGNVPAGIRPDEVMAALSEYMSFGPSAASAPARSSTAPQPPGAGASAMPRKGMTRAEADRVLGRLVSANTHQEGAVSVLTAVFDAGDSTITADFVEDILVSYSIRSK